MSTMLSITTVKGHKDYDLYISSENRDNTFVNIAPSSSFHDCPFALLYKDNPDTYFENI